MEKKMITLQDLCLYLNELYQIKLFSDYGPNGLQVEGKPVIRQIATAVSASLDTIEKAASLGADALIVHHGLFWNKDMQVITGTRKEKMAVLIKHDISLLGYHLPMDAHQSIGNNWKAANDLQWKNLQPFGYMNGIPIGVKGTFPPISRNEFLENIESYYRHPSHTAPGGKEIVQSAAIISGGAYKSITEAIAAQVDCFITGNFDEPVWHQAYEEKINFFALGHSATERVGPLGLKEHLENIYSIRVDFIDTPNPF
jgi:dinuclear metal center YbgI/SA1388 family protein